MSKEKSTREKIWAGEYFGRSGAVRRSEKELKPFLSGYEEERRWALSSLSSVHYSAAGNARARMRECHAFNPKYGLLFLLGVLHLARALRYSNQFAREVPETDMTADELHVRQSIFQKCRMSEDAMRCIRLALQKSPKPHTKALLWVSIGEIDELNGRHAVAEKAFGKAEIIILDAQREEPAQAARVFRRCADFYERSGQRGAANALRARAEKLARSSGATDQLVKMGRV